MSDSREHKINGEMIYVCGPDTEIEVGGRNTLKGSRSKQGWTVDGKCTYIPMLVSGAD